MSKNEVTQVRKQLVAVSGKLHGLEADDFATKYRLSVETDKLRERLSELDESDIETLKGWADRSGRKAAHTQVNSETLKAIIISPLETGR